MEDALADESSAPLPDSLQPGSASLRILTASEQKILGGEWVAGTRLSGLPTVRAVVNAVIKMAYELDDTLIVHERDTLLWQGHWERYRGDGTPVVATTYPVHALVSVDGIETANDVADYMNKVFETDRARYPRYGGWTAIAAHSRSATVLNNHHPFFQYRNTCRLDAACCRFLVVDKMAVEGLNNRYLGIWGAAETFASVRMAVQRIGRTLRSAARMDGNCIHVPPASHDRVQIVTHEAFVAKPNALGIAVSSAETIVGAIDFITDMYRATEDIMSIEEYIALDTVPSMNQDIARPAQLSRWGRCAIVQAVGDMLLQGRAPDIADVVRQFGGAGKLRRQFVRAYAESLVARHPTTYYEIRHGLPVQTELDAIEDLKHKILRSLPPDPTEVLEAEHIAIETMDADAARAWLAKSEWGEFVRQKWANEADAEWLNFTNKLYRSMEGRFDQYEFNIRQTPAARLAAIGDEIVRQLGVDGDTVGRVHALVLQGAIHYLSHLEVTSLAQFDVGGTYCRPEVTFALRTDTFVAQLEAWICLELLKEQRLSKIWAVLRFEHFWTPEEAS